MPPAFLRILLAVLYLTLILQKSAGQGQEWCVANEQAGTGDLQADLDWACGKGGANCTKIQVNQPCYLPDTVIDHASYAFNNYYQKFKHSGGNCSFNGDALLTSTDPNGQGQEWCEANGQTPAGDLQADLDWVCGKGGANCTMIQVNQPCYLPNTVKDHASYPFNNYHQKFKHSEGNCTFNGSALLTSTDPSHDSCTFECAP